MGIFTKKQNTNETNKIDPNELLDGPISGGNYFEFKKELEILKDKQELKWTGETISVDDNDIDRQINNYINRAIVPKYFQYWNLANYYINIFKLKCNDDSLLNQIEKMRYLAFFHGQAGLYYEGVSNKWIPVTISNIKENEFGHVCYIDICTNPCFDEIQKNPIIQRIDYKCLDKLVIYKFRTIPYSCYVWLKEYVNVQSQLMGQMSIATLINNKIVSFSMDSKFDNKKSLLSFLNPFKFWIYSRNTKDLLSSVRIQKDLIDAEFAKKQIEMIRMVQDFWKDYVGIRNNTSFKKERNTDNEIDADQAEFNSIENEILTNLEQFIKQFNSNIHSKSEVCLDVKWNKDGNG